MTPEQNRLRGQLAASVKYRPTEREHADELRRSLKELKLAEYIRKTVDAAPALSPSQRDRLALLLRGGEVA